MNHSRRTFVKNTIITSTLLPLVGPCMSSTVLDFNPEKLDVSIFSKHLQFLDCKEAAQIAAELGFDGIDLTVRPKGHILPENVSTELPNAIQDINQAGSSCKMITTSIESSSKPIDVNLIETAASNGVSYYRANWYKYDPNLSLNDSLDIYQNEIFELGEVNKKNQIVGCYQNHSGTNIGASFWEVERILSKADPDYFGTQYDIRHAIAEGGQSWVNGLNLLQSKIKTIVLKDFKWGQENGEWKPINVPIGEGMVDFTKYFRILKKYKLNPPTSLHLEYPLGGAEKGLFSISIDKKLVFDAMKKDLNTIHKLWQEA
jgi:sugar phosphate isomerase/epimerase